MQGVTPQPCHIRACPVDAARSKGLRYIQEAEFAVSAAVAGPDRPRQRRGRQRNSEPWLRRGHFLAGVGATCWKTPEQEVADLSGLQMRDRSRVKGQSVGRP